MRKKILKVLIVYFATIFLNSCGGGASDVGKVLRNEKITNKDEFLVKNELNRFALGDRDDLKFNEDGSLDLYIQTNKPSGDQTQNWLPIPSNGPFYLTLRLYWPKQEVLDGKWKIPFVVPVK